MGWTLAEMPSQAGKRFFVTGANSGIGFWTCVELARKGAVVVMASRDLGRGEEALRKLKVEAAGPESAAGMAEMVRLDLASLESVQRVAEAERGRGTALHGLINNAGVMAPKKRLETKDGFELQFGTNVLGHFALTCLLMPELERGGSSGKGESPRVVTVSSIAHKRGKVDFEDLQSCTRYDPMQAYAQSKLANLMFAFELERRLRAGRLGSTSLAVHPGVAKTNLFKIGNSEGLARQAERVMAWGIGTVLNSETGGALPTVFAATAVEARGGGYYGPQGLQEMRGNDVGEAKVVAAQAREEGAQKRLWEVCEELTGVNLRSAFQP